MIGRIYVIKSPQTDYVYIGSTTKTLNDRLCSHKSGYKAYLNEKGHYITSFELVKFEDCFIELLEEVSCKNEKELHKIEGQYIKDNMNCVNRRIEGRTRKEYHVDNQKKLIDKAN